MKKLTMISSALLLAVTASTALAAPHHGDRERNSGKHFISSKHASPGRHHDSARNRQHHKPARYARENRRDDYRGRHHRRPYNQHYYNAWRHDRHDAYRSYMGAVLVGSALTYGLHHMHHGAVCYEHHGTR
jgi:hypothetical protein